MRVVKAAAAAYNATKRNAPPLTRHAHFAVVCGMYEANTWTNRNTVTPDRGHRLSDLGVSLRDDSKNDSNSGNPPSPVLQENVDSGGGIPNSQALL